MYAVRARGGARGARGGGVAAAARAARLLTTTRRSRSSSSARGSTLEMFDSSVMRTYGRYDIVLSHGAGREAWDADGKRYLDMGGGIAVNALGHSHPELVDVIREQAPKLIHCSNLYYTEEQGMLADALTGLFADGQDSAGGKVFFCNSGAEANEGLFKLARAWGQRDGVDTDPATARFEIITADNSFHGRTVACIAATGQDKIKAGFGPMVPGYTHVPYNDLDAARDAIGPQVGYCPPARPPACPARPPVPPSPRVDPCALPTLAAVPCRCLVLLPCHARQRQS
jgi:acetylornithine/succinyldiaminopimelate/putrescine aminotransferase